jgi:hypothetical protein
MNICSTEYPPDISDLEEAGPMCLKSDLVKTASIAGSPINRSCGSASPQCDDVVIGEVAERLLDLRANFCLGSARSGQEQQL